MSGLHARPDPASPHNRHETPVFDTLSNEWITAGREPPRETAVVRADSRPGPRTRPPGAGGPTPVPGPRTGRPRTTASQPPHRLGQPASACGHEPTT